MGKQSGIDAWSKRDEGFFLDDATKERLIECLKMSDRSKDSGIETAYNRPPLSLPLEEFEEVVRAHRGATRSDSNRAEREEFQRLHSATEKLLEVLDRLTPAASRSLMENTGAEAPAIIDDLEKGDVDRLLANVLDTADTVPLKTLERHLKRLARAASYCIEDFTQDPKASRRSDMVDLSGKLSGIFEDYYKGAVRGRNSTKQSDAVRFLREGWLAAGIPKDKIPDDERMYRDYCRPKAARGKEPPE